MKRGYTKEEIIEVYLSVDGRCDDFLSHYAEALREFDADTREEYAIGFYLYEIRDAREDMVQAEDKG